MSSAKGDLYEVDFKQRKLTKFTPGEVQVLPQAEMDHGAINALAEALHAALDAGVIETLDGAFMTIMKTGGMECDAIIDMKSQDINENHIGRVKSLYGFVKRKVTAKNSQPTR